MSALSAYFGFEARDLVMALDEFHGLIAREPVEAALAALLVAEMCEAGWPPLALSKALLFAVCPTCPTSGLPRRLTTGPPSGGGGRDTEAIGAVNRLRKQERQR
jgi:hypothetical protein